MSRVVFPSLIGLARHEEYRSAFIDHLINISIRHWDPAMRSISAQSLRALCELDLRPLGPGVVGRLVRLQLLPRYLLNILFQMLLLRSNEANDVHGALLSLSELASAYGDRSEPLDGERLQVLTVLLSVPSIS
jgi:tubulin-specific chaperone D